MRAVPSVSWFVLAMCLAAQGPAVAQRKRTRPAMHQQIHRAIERGVWSLLEAQGSEQVWGSLDRLDTSPTALAVYTLIQTGTDRHTEEIEGAIERIRRAPHDHTYGIACAIMALGAHGASEHRAKIQQLADKLVRTQSRGTWGYPSGDDLSNTQFAILGLWAAERAGANVPAKVWMRAAEALPEYARPSGGFAYQRRSHGETGSMTAAGLGSIAICRAMLEDGAGEGALSEDLDWQLEVLEARALEWLADHFSGRTNPPGEGGWVAYYLYACERVGALYGTRQFGGHDWYTEGALNFLATQHEDGSWSAGGSTVASTCFALLFLRRATTRMLEVPVSGPTAGRKRDDLERLDRRDLGRNRAQIAQPTSEATSDVRDHPARLGCDGRLTTWWQAKGDDVEPMLSIEFEAPQEADTILVAHPRTQGQDVALARVVRVRVNGDATYDLSMPPVAERKGRLRLPASVPIRSIDVTVVRVEETGGGVRGSGIGEVETQMRPIRSPDGR